MLHIYLMNYNHMNNLYYYIKTKPAQGPAANIVDKTTFDPFVI